MERVTYRSNAARAAKRSPALDISPLSGNNDGYNGGDLQEDGQLEQATTEEPSCTSTRGTPEDISLQLTHVLPNRTPVGVDTAVSPTREQGQTEVRPAAQPLISTRPRSLDAEQRSNSSPSTVTSSPVKSTTTPHLHSLGQYAEAVRFQPNKDNTMESEQRPASSNFPIRPRRTRRNTSTTTVAQNVTPSKHSKILKPLVQTGTDTIHLQKADTWVIEGHRSATKLAQRAIEQTSSQKSISSTPVSRADIQHSAIRCAQKTPTTLNTGLPKRSSSRKTSNKFARPQAVSHDLVASPALGSSIGFVYRKAEKTRAKDKAKPHPITFNSSPGVTRDNGMAQEEGQEHPIPSSCNGVVHPNRIIAAETQAPRPNVYDVMANDTAGTEDPMDKEGQGNRRSSRLSSDYSTQAALLLAQMDFQQGTFPSFSSDIPRAALYSQDDTPQPKKREPSPVITPFHTFNAELDRRHPDPPESALQGPPISTQDLWIAASPFAFSTVKKKNARPLRSGLRFAVHSNKGDERENGVRSPTPSIERVPLKDRNYKVAFRSTPEKGSQDSLLRSSRRSTKDVELSLLDFRASLDSMGPNGDLEFTDRFLRNLDNLT